MAVALVNNTMTFGLTSGTTITQSFSPSGSDRLLLVQANSSTQPPSQTVNSVTFNGVSLSKIADSTDHTVWKLANPTSGAANVVITMSAYVGVWRAYTAWTGADQSSPTGTVVVAGGTSSTPSTGSVTCPTSGAVYGGEHSGYTSGSAPSITAGTSINTQRDGGSGETFATGYRTSTGSVSWSISSSPTWKAFGIPINAVAAAIAAPISRFVRQAVNRAGSY